MTGKVYIVGAGPGDPDLITIKAIRCIQEADVVIYDRLVDSRIVNMIPNTAERIYVGKSRGEKVMPQENINDLIVNAATSNKTVVRLKGGDPFIFGRGGEEASELSKAGIPFEIVPGITSAIAAPAYAGIPLTQRSFASSFLVVSGDEDPSKQESLIDWQHIAAFKGTIVILMGWRKLQDIITSLLKHGMGPSVPVALIQWGTVPLQKTVTGSLVNIVEESSKAGMAPPTIIVIGKVVELRTVVRWFEKKPLFGKKVLITRPNNNTSILSDLLEREGAHVVSLPTIEIVPVPDFSDLDIAIKQLDAYDWIIFNSLNAVSALFTRMKQIRIDTRSFMKAKICAIGESTAKALERHGILPDLIPDKYLTSSIAAQLNKNGVSGNRILIPRTNIASNSLVEKLENSGAKVEQVTAYHTIIPETAEETILQLLKNNEVDIVIFTSSSTVKNLLRLLHGDTDLLNAKTIATIGPITSQAARKMGIEVNISAQKHTIQGLVSDIVTYYS